MRIRGGDLGTVQLAIGVIISGPVRLAIETGKSLALDSLVGDNIKEGFDALATSLVAAAHDTDSNTVRSWTNSENIDVIINSNSENKEDELFFENDLVKKKQGAEYLINAVAGVVGVGVGKGVAKGEDANIFKSGFEIGSNNPITGHKVLGTHKDESNNTIGDYIVEGTKPSTKDKVIKSDIQYYENPWPP